MTSGDPHRHPGGQAAAAESLFDLYEAEITHGIHLLQGGHSKRFVAFVTTLLEDLQAKANRVGETLGAVPSVVDHLLRDASGNTFLHWAARVGDEVSVEYLLDFAKASSTAENVVKDTPLHCAAAAANQAVINVLLRRGADPWRCNALQMTMFDVIRECGPPHLSKAFLKLELSGADDSCTGDTARVPVSPSGPVSLPRERSGVGVEEHRCSLTQAAESSCSSGPIRRGFGSTKAPVSLNVEGGIMQHVTSSSAHANGGGLPPLYTQHPMGSRMMRNDGLLSPAATNRAQMEMDDAAKVVALQDEHQMAVASLLFASYLAQQAVGLPVRPVGVTATADQDDNEDLAVEEHAPPRWHERHLADRDVAPSAPAHAWGCSGGARVGKGSETSPSHTVRSYVSEPVAPRSTSCCDSCSELLHGDRDGGDWAGDSYLAETRSSESAQLPTHQETEGVLPLTGPSPGSRMVMWWDPQKTMTAQSGKMIRSVTHSLRVSPAPEPISSSTVERPYYEEDAVAAVVGEKHLPMGKIMLLVRFAWSTGMGEEEWVHAEEVAHCTAVMAHYDRLNRTDVTTMSMATTVGQDNIFVHGPPLDDDEREDLMNQLEAIRWQHQAASNTMSHSVSIAAAAAAAEVFGDELRGHDVTDHGSSVGSRRSHVSPPREAMWHVLPPSSNFSPIPRHARDTIASPTAAPLNEMQAHRLTRSESREYNNFLYRSALETLSMRQRARLSSTAARAFNFEQV